MFNKDPCLTKNEDPYSPHCIIPTLVRANTSLLDVGCNTGYLGRTLAAKDVTCDGIDINEDALKQAAKDYRSVYHRNLDSCKMDLPEGAKYDHIVMSDVLEHIARPDLLLKDAIQYLKTNGTLIASLPNIARLEIRLKLLFGSFDYESAGILHQDHLRFFTRKSASELFTKQGYSVSKVLPTGFGARTGVLPTLTAYQFIFVCNARTQ